MRASFTNFRAVTRKVVSYHQPQGFTLVELLIVIGVVVLLLAILLPAVRHVRIAAERTLCASRLNQLTAAVTFYLNQNKAYPPAPFIDMQGAAIPQFVPVSLIDQLCTDLAIPRIDDSTPIDRQPKVLLCPFREQMQVPAYDAPMKLPGGSVMLTGYQYTAGLDAPQNLGGGRVLQRAHAPDTRGRRRGVIWSDVLGWYSGSGLVMLPGTAPPAWIYFHFTSSVQPTALGMADTTALAGQHRAWTDGSVEWVPAASIDLNLDDRDKSAAYGMGKAGAYYAYYWF